MYSGSLPFPSTFCICTRQLPSTTVKRFAHHLPSQSAARRSRSLSPDVSLFRNHLTFLIIYHQPPTRNTRARYDSPPLQDVDDELDDGGSPDEETLPDDSLGDISDLPLLDNEELNTWQLRLLIDPNRVTFTLQAPTTDIARAEFVHLLKSLVSGTKVYDYQPQLKDPSVSCSISDPKALLSCIPPFRM